MTKTVDPNDRRYVRKWATARKARRCRGCGAGIEPGQQYWQVSPGFVPAVGFCSDECEARTR